MRGLVIKSTGSLCLVKTVENNIIPCTIRGKIRLEGTRSTNPVVVGDWVEISHDKKQGKIISIEERKNYIVRKSVNLSKQSHVIASNLDQSVLVVTLIQPLTSTEFIDRYLCTAEAYRIPVVIVFNKTDLYDESEKELLESLIDTYEQIGYHCLKISAKNGDGIDILRELLSHKVSLISGHSGVGKSSIIKILEPESELKIAQISDYHLKGKHTTTFSEMFELTGGGYVIDTPGIKGFGLINIGNEELFHFFPEIFRTSHECQYYNCTHVHEPKCAVMKSVENGTIAISRYRSYINILLDSNDKHRI
jgi:ribosome biogenesis GTPase / thiamine phosphate phosphatase